MCFLESTFEVDWTERARKLDGEEGLVEAGGGEADDVVVVAVDLGDGGGADPFLDGVGAGLVVRLEGVDVVRYFVVNQYSEGDFSSFVETDSICGGAENDAGDDLVGAAREKLDHTDGVFAVLGLAEDVLVAEDEGVGGEENFVGCEVAVEGGGLMIGKELGNLVVRHVGTECLGRILGGLHAEWNAEH